LDLIPPEKIHFSKRVLSHFETGNGVTIRTADNETHQGTILVGADGAYSGVRQSLYEHLDKEKRLPTSDKAPLKYSTVCLVGHTLPLDPDVWPAVQGEWSQCDSVHGENNPYFVCQQMKKAKK
jgi:2-polyprenyl-6-methoxyphenol hydroxylase-like FAD-dependent oxidoreductase